MHQLFPLQIPTHNNDLLFTSQARFSFAFFKFHYKCWFLKKSIFYFHNTKQALFFHSTLFIFFIAVIRVSNYIFICVIICLLCLPSRIKTSVRPTQCLLYAAQSTETDNQLMSKTMTDVLK